jgi:hypothetical protein
MTGLIVAYPELVIGIVAGLVAASRGWRITPIMLAGAALALILVVSDADLTNVCAGHGECTPPTKVEWIFVAIANTGGWAFGVATGAALVWSRRRTLS